MTRVIGKLLTLAFLLLGLSLLTVGCGPPPDIAEEDVVGFAIGFDPGIYIDSSLPDPPESLERLITAYNASG